MRLLRAELRKLRRPLVAWTCLALVVLIGIVDWQQIRGVSDQVRFSIQAVGGPIPTSCEQIGVPPGPECDSQLAQMRAVFCQDNGVPTGPQCDQILAELAAEEERAQADYRRLVAAQIRTNAEQRASVIQALASNRLLGTDAQQRDSFCAASGAGAQR